MWGILYLFQSLLFVCLLVIVFKSKKSINSEENKLFNIMTIEEIVVLITEILLNVAVNNLGGNNAITIVLARLFLVEIFFWFCEFSIYTYYITRARKIESEEKRNKVYNFAKSVIGVIMIIGSLLFVFLPIQIMISGEEKYSYGPAVNALKVALGLGLTFWLVLLVASRKDIKQKQFAPIYAVILLLIVNLILQTVNPSILIASSTMAFTLFIMFFTIENPDLKLVQQLEIAKEAADKANNSKTEFLSSMSHEIRTPLNAIVGFSDCIMDAGSIEEAKENAKDIVNASQTLLEIVNGILDISKIEAGKLEIINTKYNPKEVFTELATLITPRMKEKGLDFTFFIDPNLPATLFGDKANIKKIVTNFLSNACKYTDHGFVRYEVHCVKLEDYCRLVISVEDSGRGIKTESVDKLFTRFQRLDEDRNTTIEGTGLGLAITKQLTELMGGKVIVHTVYGEGSKFTAVINQKIDSMTSVETPKQYTHLDLTGIRILVVDDAQLNLKVTDKLLKKYGADHVDLCTSGFECIEKIKNGDEYDLLFLDDMMPRMNGIETFHKLKENPNFHIPTIALTANAITGMREKYLAEGFNDYLAKPMEQNELIRVCNDLLGRNTGFTAKIEIPKEELEEKNSDVIPVEENIEEIIEKKEEPVTNVESPPKPSEAEESVKVSEFTPVIAPTTTAPVVNLIPVVDIHFGKDSSKEDKKETEEVLTEEPSHEVLEEIAPVEETPEKVENLSEEVIEEPVVDSQEEVYDRSYLEKHGADINHALELLGDMEMYNATIQDFLTEVEDKWQRLQDYRDSGDMKNYAIDVHSLKSDCKYLGFMTLADIAYQHELKSKENDLEYVREHFPELEEEYKKTLEVAKNYSSHNPVEE
ncbi:MAG: response regulator [Bacilli bacterium]|nr:response regulator [Bacilli bacterium]